MPSSKPAQFFSRARNLCAMVSHLAALCSDSPTSGMLGLVGTVGNLEALGLWVRSVKIVTG